MTKESIMESVSRLQKTFWDVSSIVNARQDNGNISRVEVSIIFDRDIDDPAIIDTGQIISDLYAVLQKNKD